MYLIEKSNVLIKETVSTNCKAGWGEDAEIGSLTGFIAREKDAIAAAAAEKM